MKLLKQLFSIVGLVCFAMTTQLDAQEFRFGANAGFSLSQIEGDNLRGFRKINPEIGILGGYKISEADEIIVSLSYENSGSKRGNESNPLVQGKYLNEVDMNQASLGLLYSRNFSPDWDGTYKYRAYAGVRYNRIMQIKSSTVSSSIADTYTLDDNNDFKSNYLNLQMGFGFSLSPNFILDLGYFHALQSIVHNTEDLRISKMIPFGLKCSLAYYIQ